MGTIKDSTALSEIGEKSFIELFIRPLTRVVGDDALFDDCQFLSVPIGETLCVSTDRTPSDLRMLKWGHMSLEEYGAYSVTTNLSDLAAVNANPLGYLLNLGLPPNMLVGDLRRLLRGVKTALERYNVGLAGGDSKEHALLNMVGVALGSAQPQHLLKRSAACPGQNVFYFGPGIGLAPAAFKYFSQTDRWLSKEDENSLRRVLVEPVARFTDARLLAEGSACIDNSDGVIASLREIARAARVGFELEITEQHLPNVVSNIAKVSGIDAMQLALTAGGDFGLIATSNQTQLANAIKVGKVVATQGIQHFDCDYSGVDESVFDHFRPRPF